jgi:hypothetical protein
VESGSRFARFLLAVDDGVVLDCRVGAATEMAFDVGEKRFEWVFGCVRGLEMICADHLKHRRSARDLEEVVSALSRPFGLESDGQAHQF